MPHLRIIGRAATSRRRVSNANVATLRFLLKRFVAQRLLGLAVVVTLAFSVGVLVAGPIYADAAREAILSSALQGAPVTVGNARVQVYGSAGFDWPAADEVVEMATSGLPLDVLVRQGLSTVRLGGAGGPSVPLLFRDLTEEHLEFRGRPPGAGGIAVAQGALRGASPGDPVAIVGPSGESLTLTLSGTFVPPPRDDPFWFGTRSPFPAPDSTQPSPALLDRETMLHAASTLGLTTEFSWDAFLRLDGLAFERALTVPVELQRIEERLRSEPALADLQVASGLGTLLQIVELRVENLRIPILLVVFQIGAVTLAVLAGVGALTLTRQAFELSVLHSRGFSRRTLLAAQTVQAVFAAIAAYPLGLLLGVALAKLAGHSNGPALPGVLFPVRLTGPAQLLGVVAAVLGAVILILLSLPHVSRTVLEERRAVSREDRPLLARLPVEAVILPVGIFAFIQLRGGAKPEPGSGSIDPLVLLAPTLLLFAASFLALRLLLFSFRRLDRRIGRTRKVSVYLAGRRLGRAPGTGFAAALLLLLSIGLMFVSTSYRAIVLRNHADAAHTQVGADWNVQVFPPEDVLAAIRRMPPGTTPVVRTDPGFEQGSFPLPPTALAIDPATYAQGGWWRSDYSDLSLEEILTELRTEPIGVELPAAASELRVTLRVPRSALGLGIVATTQDDAGATSSPPPSMLDVGVGSYEIPIDGAVRLLSVALRADTSLDLPSELEIGIEALDVDGEPLSLAGWVPLTWRGSRGELVPDGDGYRYAFLRGAGNVVGGLVPASDPLPALVSPTVASTQGGTFAATLGGQQVVLRQIGTATQFPSVVPNAPFVVLSAPALLQIKASVPDPGLALNEVWATGDESPVPALRRAGFIPGQTQEAEPIEAILAQLPQSLAVGMNFTAAAGGLGLVIIGVAAGLYFAQRRRDYEFAALRAMGTDGRQIRRTLALEQFVLLGFSLVAGLGLGYLLLRLMMPYVGTSLATSYPPPVVVVDWTSLGVSLAAIVAASSIGLLLAIRTLMRSSVTGVLRGEAE
jgi:putative ABC transport system permease protein